MSVVTLSAAGVDDVSLDGSANHAGFVLRGVDGWYETPGAKTEVTERDSGDGAHDVAARDLQYSSRVVTIFFRLLVESARDRQGLLDMITAMRRFTHRLVTVRVQDDLDLEATGYVDSIDLDDTQQNMAYQTCTGQMSIVCARPEIVSHTPVMQSLIPYRSSSGGGGLMYGPGYFTEWAGEPNDSVSYLYLSTVGTRGLHYPLTYSVDPPEAGSNTCLLRNRGSSRAYPVFTCYGTMQDGVDLVFPSENLWLRCTQPVYGEPLVLDSRSRTATVGGLDVSRTLTSRGFPTVPPDGTLSCLLRTTGSGYVNVTVRDTYI